SSRPQAHSLLVVSITQLPTTEIYTLSLHDALPISHRADRIAGGGLRRPLRRPVADGRRAPGAAAAQRQRLARPPGAAGAPGAGRSEEHTSELQSRENLVCRLLLEKKNKTPPTKKKH